ncbi:heparan-alpha-glucosaminide N-acetyltransferase-like protein isoform X1 [Cinnamomum micranthum f. kanehirae]|uniref:Heparan-alpha-glucosaminide N-acetyltransferase-like protein isoform X1 n=1 Tax=Cinnamomum micranthum f. kanehirae TaxID=337451 RepID=A0A443P5F1_9MAGN|nr:heparan-alpha-glucosaminide N-acetyltransferase-like protein isoform X1 [Cinnamomum micranthum f. kanehirae]
MADYELVNEREPEAEVEEKKNSSSTRIVSLDVFRGLSVFLMIFVDYSGSVLPLVAHSPWNGIHLADFVMPFFLFIAGVSVALVHKKVSNKFSATCNAVQRAIKLFLIGIFLQGGYFHGVNSLTFGVDIGSIRWFGILQRIAVGYVIAALCEIWFQGRKPSEERVGLFKGYYYHWFTAFSLSTVYMGLLHGLYVPDWHVKLPLNNTYVDHTVKCGVRGDLGPACNSAGMIDRYILGADHLYRKPVYRNLKQCSDSFDGQVSECSPAWCCAPFDPEGILSSFTAAVTCIIGLHFGHVLVQREDHKDRLFQWSLFSMSLLSLALLLTFIGIPLNKPLYTINYMMLTSAFAGIIFSALYFLVDVYGYKRLLFPLEWMGKHSLSIFVLVASNIAIIAIQGFYKAQPQNNIIHWIISVFVKT